MKVLKISSCTVDILGHTLCQKCIYLWLGSFGVINLCSVIPVLRLLGFGVGNLLRRKEVPVVLKVATLHTLVVNLHLVGVVRTNDEGVQVSEFVILWGGRGGG